MCHVFTNIWKCGEILCCQEDAHHDYYNISDAQNDHNYFQDKISESLEYLLGTSNHFPIIYYGGRVTDGGSGTIDISAGYALGYDTDGNKRAFPIPAMTGVVLPTGWDDNRDIWVVLQYQSKLGTATRNSYTGCCYHYTVEDSYYGDTDSDLLFVDSQPSDVLVLGKFGMSSTTFTDRTTYFGNLDRSDEAALATKISYYGSCNNPASISTTGNTALHAGASCCAFTACATCCYGICSQSSCDYAGYFCSGRCAGVIACALCSFGVVGMACCDYGGSFCANGCYGVRGVATYIGVQGQATCDYAGYFYSGRCYGVRGAATYIGVEGQATCNCGGSFCANGCFGIYGCACSCFGVYGTSGTKYGVRGDSITTGVYGGASCDYGVYGEAGRNYGVYGTSGCVGVQGVGCYCGVVGYGTNSCAVSGNTAYENTSSSYLKHKEEICLINCIRANPIRAYKYLWEDSNNKSWNYSVGPMAEDIKNTFKLTKKGDKISGLEGIAFGLGIELLEKIEILENKIKMMESR